jgi:hypothetical protein
VDRMVRVLPIIGSTVSYERSEDEVQWSSNVQRQTHMTSCEGGKPGMDGRCKKRWCVLGVDQQTRVVA